MGLPTGVTTVLGDLRAATNGYARAAGPDDAVPGAVPDWVASPASTSETSAVLRAASVHGLAVLVRGAGTKIGWGRPPERADLVLDTTRMDALVEHAAGDLVAVVGAGRRLHDLAGDLAASGQRLGIDPPRAGTVGGAVAAGATGPLRLAHGAVRDLVIGVRVVRADGVVAHAGGKVVKNVAGYDLGKLLTGSFGTLGVLTEVAFRLHPVPEARRWVGVTTDSDERLVGSVRDVVHSQVVPAAVELDRPGDGRSCLVVLLEGTGPGVDARAERVLMTLGEGAVSEPDPPPWWGSEPRVGDHAGGVARDHGAGRLAGPAADEGDALVKVTHEIAGLGPLLRSVDAAAEVAGLRVALRGSPAVGTALVAVAGPLGGTAGRGGLDGFLEAVRARSAGFGGTAVLLDAPAAVADGCDVWGPVAGLELMRAVKRQFDPERRLAPGRFVGGI